jgi:oxygen-independent coproporphyrinogen III oxidase
MEQSRGRVMINGINLSNKCTFNHITDKRKRQKAITTKEIKHKILSIKNKDISRISFITGESLIRNDALELIEYAKSLGFQMICLITNGSLFSYENILKQYINAGLNSIIYSIYGHDDTLHDSITGRKGSFEQIIKAIENTKKISKFFGESNFHWGVNVIVSSYNYLCFYEISKFLINIGAHDAEFIFTDPINARPGEFHKIIPKVSNMIDYIKKGLDHGIKNNLKQWHLKHFPLCYFEDYGEYMGENNSFFEEGIYIGLKSNFFGVDFRGQAARKYKGPQCINCKLNDRCRGIWSDYAIYYGVSELIPVLNIREIKIELINDHDSNNGLCYNLKRNSPKRKTTGKKSHLSKMDVFLILEQVKKIGVKSVCFTAREAFMYPYLRQVLKKARSMGFYILLNTDMVKIVYGLLKYIDELSISVDNQEKMVYLDSGHVLEKIRKADACRLNNLIIRCHTSLTKSNVRELDLFYDYFKEKLGKTQGLVDNWFFLRPANTDLNKEDIVDAIDKISFLNKKLSPIKGGISSYIANGIPFCVLGGSIPEMIKVSKVCAGAKNDNGSETILIRSDGKIMQGYSTEIVLGNLKDLKKAINSDQISLIRRFEHLPSGCLKCELLYRCRGGLSDSNKLDGLINHTKFNNRDKLKILKNTILSRSYSKKQTKAGLYQNDKSKEDIIIFHRNSEFKFQYPPSYDWNDEYIDLSELNLLGGNVKPCIENLYIHLPFCLYTCKYCTFPKMILKEQTQIDEYLDYLDKEIEIYINKFHKIAFDFKPKTIYVGGGTPSILSLKQIEKLFLILNKYGLLSDVKEFTFESNPDSLNEQKIKLLKKRGVTRISLGIQSLDEGVLKAMNRKYTKRDILNIFKIIKENDFVTNVDFLYGLPGQGLEKFKEEMSELVALGSDNITYQKVHNLDGSNLSAFGYQFNDAAVEKMNLLGRKIMRDYGYTQYSEEDYALHNNGFIFQRNNLLGKNMLGVGLSSISYINGNYFRNIFEYINYKEILLKNNLPLTSFKRLSKDDKLRKEVSFGIKRLGINLTDLENKFSICFYHYFKKEIEYLINSKLIKITDESLFPTNLGMNYIDFISWIFMKK